MKTTSAIILFGVMFCTQSCKWISNGSKTKNDTNNGSDASANAEEMRPFEDPKDPGFLNLDGQQSPKFQQVFDPSDKSISLAAIEAVTSGADEYYSWEACKRIRAATTQTSECRDYCDTFRREGAVDTALYWGTWLSWSSYFPPAMRDQVGKGITTILASSSTAVGNDSSALAGKYLTCAAVLVSYLSAETLDVRRCEAGSQCVSCGAAAGPRTACRVWDSLRICAQTMGMKLPILTPAGVLARTCGLGVTAQQEAYRGICRGACSASIKAATSIAQAETVTSPAGVTSDRKLCCRCVRSHREDHWFKDPEFASDFHNSTTASGEGESDDCEGRNNRRFFPENGTRNGYRTYYQYSKCEKYYVNGATCPTDPQFNPYSTK